MHGRPRGDKKKLEDPAAAAGYKKKVDTIRNATNLVLELRQKKRYDQPALDASAKLLKVVPEIYTLWNYRREALAPVFEAGGAPAQAASDSELLLTQACLIENPKSYCTWHQRKWVVQKGLCSLAAELKLVSRALDADERNFHAWNYRQFVVSLLGRSAGQELEYAEEKVVQDFSNYSAWHYRTILLPKLHGEEAPTISFADLLAGGTAAGGRSSSTAGQHSAAAAVTAAATPHSNDAPDVNVKHASSPAAVPAAAAAVVTGPTATTSAAATARRPSARRKGPTGSAAATPPVPVHILDQEYDMVHQAFAVDARDQSPWMYYRWLAGNSLAHLEAAAGTPREHDAREVLKQVLCREVRRLEEDHIRAVPDAKWPLLTVARLKEAQARLQLADGREEELLKEVAQLYARLAELDPMRRGYYLDAIEGKAFVIVQALGTV